MDTTIQSLKTTFNQVLGANRIKNELKDNPSFKAIFNILNTDESLISAIDISEVNRPALSANVSKIEDYVLNNPSCGINLTDDATKQAIGTLQKIVLEPFGYTPVKSKRLTNSKFFSSAACYELNSPARLKIIKTISIA